MLMLKKLKGGTHSQPHNPRLLTPTFSGSSHVCRMLLRFAFATRKNRSARFIDSACKPSTHERVRVGTGCWGALLRSRGRGLISPGCFERAVGRRSKNTADEEVLGYLSDAGFPLRRVHLCGGVTWLRKIGENWEKSCALSATIQDHGGEADSRSSPSCFFRTVDVDPVIEPTRNAAPFKN